MTWTRRRILKFGGAVAGMSAAGLQARWSLAGDGPVQPALARTAARRIELRNLHTGERLDVEYHRDGEYLPDALTAIRVLLRDFRNDEQHDIDRALMDYLCAVAEHTAAAPVFSVISGYRSPQTNALLRDRSSGVARRSLHLEGRAIDVRLTGVDCATFANAALELARGGVGYYRASDFVHLDTGAFRTWKG